MLNQTANANPPDSGATELRNTDVTATPDHPSVVEAFAGSLALAGCERAYGLAGEDHVELMHALERVGIRYVRAYNESSAVLMASADAQATGRVGVALVSMSAGMSNAINGLTHAFMEQVPLLVISGRQAATKYPFTIRQGFEVASLAKPVTKWQVQAAPGVDAGRLLAKAIFTATEEPAGPVYIELPADAGRTPAAVDARWRSRLRSAAAKQPHSRPRILDQHELAQIDALLSAAKRPLLVAGGRDALDGAALTTLAQARRIPALTTPNQKGTLPRGCDYDAGVFTNGTPERRLLDQADVVLAVNLQGFDIYGAELPPELEIISLSAAPIADTFISFAHEFVGDPDDAVRRLATAVPGSSEWEPSEVSDYRSWVRDSLRELDRSAGALTTTAAAAALAEALPDEVTVVADAGFSKPILVQLWEPTAPGSFFASNAFGTMGHALPTAIALKLADPAKRVVAVMGDGSFLMRAGELQAAVDAGTNPVIVVFCDRSFTQIAVKQQRRGLPNLGVDLPALSAEALGKAFGCRGVDVDSADALSEALASALASDAPTVIGIHTDNSNANAVFGFLRG